MKKTSWLLKCLDLSTFEFLNEAIDASSRDILAPLVSTLNDLKRLLTDVVNQLKTNTDFSSSKAFEGESFVCSLIKETCFVEIERLNMPPVRPRVIEKTDGGPGVAANNFSVHFREAELSLLHRSSQRYRIHLASEDQVFNEAERTNAYVGDALVDGTALKTDYFDKYHGLTESEVEKMSIQELNDHAEKLKERTAWMISEEVKQRIDDEPGPGNSIMKSYLTRSEESQFFYNSNELRMWHKAGVKANKFIPGNDYFSKIASYCKDHIDVGELYLEYRWGRCKDITGKLCDTCNSYPCTGPVAEPMPRPMPDKENVRKYLSHENTPKYSSKDSSTSRPIDDFQPRFQLKEMFKAGKIKRGDKQSVRKFCLDFAASEKEADQYLCHLNDLELLRNKRKLERQKQKVVKLPNQVNKEHSVIEQLSKKREQKQLERKQKMNHQDS